MTQENLEATQSSGTGFDLPADDPRRTDNRGGLDSDVGTAGDPHPGSGAAAMGPSNIGTTGARGIVNDDIGAGGSGEATATGDQVNLGTTGMVASTYGPPGVGPIEGSASGIVSPQVEFTDLGPVDIAATDMSVTGDDENLPGGGARVENENGEPL